MVAACFRLGFDLLTGHARLGFEGVWVMSLYHVARKVYKLQKKKFRKLCVKEGGMKARIAMPM